MNVGIYIRFGSNVKVIIFDEAKKKPTKTATK